MHFQGNSPLDSIHNFEMEKWAISNRAKTESYLFSTLHVDANKIWLLQAECTLSVFPPALRALKCLFK